MSPISTGHLPGIRHPASPVHLPRPAGRPTALLLAVGLLIGATVPGSGEDVSLLIDPASLGRALAQPGPYPVEEGSFTVATRVPGNPESLVTWVRPSVPTPNRDTVILELHPIGDHWVHSQWHDYTQLAINHGFTTFNVDFKVGGEWTDRAISYYFDQSGAFDAVARAHDRLCAECHLPWRRLYVIGGCGGAIAAQHLAEQRPDLCAGAVLLGGHSFIQSANQGTNGTVLILTMPADGGSATPCQGLADSLAQRGNIVWSVNGFSPWGSLGDADGWFYHNQYDPAHWALSGRWLAGVAARRDRFGDDLTLGWAYAANRDPLHPRLVRCDRPGWREALGDETRPILLPDQATAAAWAALPRHGLPIPTAPGVPATITREVPGVGPVTGCAVVDLPGPGVMPTGIAWLWWGPGHSGADDVGFATGFRSVRDQGLPREYLAQHGWAAVEWPGGIDAFPGVRQQVITLLASGPVGAGSATLPQVVVLIHPTANDCAEVHRLSGLWTGVVVLDGDDHPAGLAPGLMALHDRWPTQVVVARRAQAVADDDLAEVAKHDDGLNLWKPVVRAPPAATPVAAYQQAMAVAERFLTEAVRQLDRPADAGAPPSSRPEGF